MVEAAEITRRYQRAAAYAQSRGLPERVQRCEDFYIGEQWKGCEAADLDKPVMNILKRVVAYFMGSIVSDDIAVGVTALQEEPDGEALARLVRDELAGVMEQAGVKRKLRTLLRNAAVDGDGCLHYWFDPAPLPGQQEDTTPGSIKAEVLENYNVFFGNPQSNAVQSQPWLLVRYRRGKNETQRQLHSRGVLQTLQAESGTGVNEEGEEEKVTVLRQYWRRQGTVWYAEVCQNQFLVPPTDTRRTLYPLVFMPWEPVKNSCYGKSAIEAMIPNQIFINKLYAMAMRHVMLCAFPKVVYNRALLPEGWTNRVGEAIPVNGQPDMAVGAGLKVPDMSGQVMQLIARVTEDTKQSMGTSDAGLGTVRPENTGAIIAAQKATAQPLELQKLAFYDAVEDSVRIWLDMMAACYGLRRVTLTQTDGTRTRVLFPFDRLRGIHLKLNVDIGAGSYWSELVQVQTLDNLFKSGVLTDPVVYLQSLPRGCLQGREELIERLRGKPDPKEVTAV